MHDMHSVVLPSGRVLDLRRPRSAGVLDDEELEYCRNHAIELGYDCAQAGWVPLGCDDDLAEVLGGGEPLAGEGMLESELLARKGSFARLCERAADDVRAGALTHAEARTRLSARAGELFDDWSERHDLVQADRARAVLDTMASRALALFAPRPEPKVDAGLLSRVAFRKWRRDDASTYARLLGTSNMWRYLAEDFPAPFTEEMARRLIEVSWVEEHHEVLAVELDGVPVGQCRLRFDVPLADHRQAEVAYWVGEEHWGKGLMSAVLREYTRQSFARHHLDALYGWVIAENVGSLKVMSRAGFRRDACAHEDELARALKKGKGAVRMVAERAERAHEVNRG